MLEIDTEHQENARVSYNIIDDILHNLKITLFEQQRFSLFISLAQFPVL